jgi:putative flippase GtrA
MNSPRKGGQGEETMSKISEEPKKSGGDFLRFIKFTLFSASAGIIQIASFTLLFELAGFPYWPAYLIALALSVVYNFTINRRFTFKSMENYAGGMLKVLGYYLVFTPLSTWWGERMTAAGMNEYIMLIGTMLVNFITEYLFCRFFIYRRSMDTRPSSKGGQGA